MNTTTITTTLMNQVNQPTNNQSIGQPLEGDLFAKLFQKLVNGQVAAQSDQYSTIKSTPKEELSALMQQSIMNNLEGIPSAEQTVDPSVEVLFEESQSSTNSSLIDSLFASLQLILYNSTNLVEDLRNWYDRLPADQKRSFDLLITQGQLQDMDQNLHANDELSILLKHHFKDSSIVEMVQKMILKEFTTPAQPMRTNEVPEQGLFNVQHNEKLMPKEKQTPIMLERIDLSRIKGEGNDFVAQGKSEQTASTKVNIGSDNETASLDIKQLQSSYTNALIATKEGPNNVSGSVSNTVYAEVSGKDLSSELGKLMMKNIKLPNGVTEMKIQLHPHELGKIDIKLTTQQGNLTAMFVADTLIGKEMLENSLHLLRHSLVQQGIQVDRMEVISSGSGNALHGDHTEQNSPFHQQNHSSQHHKGKSTYYDAEQNFLPEDPITELMEIDEMNALIETRGINYTV